MDVDAFEEWCAARKRVQAVQEAADERGGPSLSLVPVEEQNVAWPTDLITEPEEGAEPVKATPFDGVELPESRKRVAAWSAERQRLFWSIWPRPARSISPATPRG
jgi:hypothetical protein